MQMRDGRGFNVAAFFDAWLLDEMWICVAPR
jgi:hypothetical protein